MVKCGWILLQWFIAAYYQVSSLLHRRSGPLLDCPKCRRLQMKVTDESVNDSMCSVLGRGAPNPDRGGEQQEQIWIRETIDLTHWGLVVPRLFQFFCFRVEQLEGTFTMQWWGGLRLMYETSSTQIGNNKTAATQGWWLNRISRFKIFCLLAVVPCTRKWGRNEWSSEKLCNWVRRQQPNTILTNKQIRGSTSLSRSTCYSNRNQHVGKSNPHIHQIRPTALLNKNNTDRTQKSWRKDLLVQYVD